MKKYKYMIKNLECANCAKKIENKLKENDRLNNVVLNFAKETLSFEGPEDLDFNNEVKKIAQSIEPGVSLLKPDEEEKTENIKLQVVLLIIGVLIGGVSLVIKNNILSAIFMIIAYVILILRPFKAAVVKITKSHLIDESTLICISAIGAYLVKKPLEGMMVLALYELGKILEAKAINKTRKSIKELLSIKPEYANLKKGNKSVVVDPSQVKIGDILIVKAGEKVPVDGVIVNGKTKLDKSVITGESKYFSADIGDNILSGSVNVGNTIEIKATCLYEESTVSRIIELTENATDRKAKTENFVAKMAKVYVPIVMILAVIVGVFLPLIANVTYSVSIYRALMFLVISCPCAIAISVPLSYFCGIGRASSSGILIKGSDFLDALRNIKVIGLDKTGTITTGKFKVSNVESFDENYTKEQILELCALGESYSNHPIAQAILEENKKELDLKNVKNHKEIAGQGISYKLDDNVILIGNEKLVGLTETQNSQITAIYLSVAGSVKGKVELSDSVKASSIDAIEELKDKNINVNMLTGDSKEVAEAVALKVGINNVYSEFLPEDKYSKIQEFITAKKNDNEKVAFVGDGINDSPVIAISDIGICMGKDGVGSSIEAADVVIMTEDLTKVNEAIHISKRTNRIIKENLIFALGMKITFLTLSVLGLTNMMVAVFADVGVTVLTILNSIRILKK